MRYMLLFILLLHAPIGGQTRKPTAVTPKPDVPMAKWTSGMENVLGLTQDDFNQAGLSKLRQQEMQHLLDNVVRFGLKMKEEGKSQQPTYSCNPIAADYEKVKIIVEANADMASEVVSSVRQKFRAMQDVEIVFAPMEADFTVNILGLTNHSQAGGVMGYTAAVVTYDTCEMTFGSAKWPARVMRNNWIFTSPSTTQLAETIATSVDTEDVESSRKLHAGHKKRMESK